MDSFSWTRAFCLLLFAHVRNQAVTAQTYSLTVTGLLVKTFMPQSYISYILTSQAPQNLTASCEVRQSRKINICIVKTINIELIIQELSRQYLQKHIKCYNGLSGPFGQIEDWNDGLTYVT